LSRKGVVKCPERTIASKLRFLKSTMRSVINHQMMFGQTDISAIEFNEKSRDDMPKILRGLQGIYTNIELRERVFSILKEVRPERKNGKGKADPRTGRPGMDQWAILVMGVVRLVRNADYDHLHDLVNHHDKLRQMLGHNDWTDKTCYELQTIKDNVRLFTPELLDRINQEVIIAGHALVKKKEHEKVIPLMSRCDSFVVETNVHFPADIIQLYDAIRQAIELCAHLSVQLGSTQWRQSSNNIRTIKRLLRSMQNYKRSTSKNPEQKAVKDEKYKELVQHYLDEVDYQLKRAENTSKELFASNPLLKSKLNYYIAHATLQMGQVRRRVFNKEVIPHDEKVFSVFQPHTEWISKGKAGVPVEFGLAVCIVEDQFGFILHHQVMKKTTDSAIAVSIVKETKQRFLNLHSISYDKGFHSKTNQTELIPLIKKVVLPKKGKLSIADKARESEQEFKRLRRKHSAVESAIHGLEVHGLDRCPDDGIKGFERYVALAVLSRNIHQFGALLLKQDARRHRGPYKKAA
jgi:transposase, IS5 family